MALCQNGQPTLARETELGHFRVKVPSVNVHSVGAGGGSIAHVPELTKALRVGPQSAGADPGPACYGKGGEEPAVTDANVVVGHLPPSLLGGEMSLDADAAHAAVKKVGEALGLDVHQAAQGILDIVNENMAGALRLVSVQRGYDPRDFAMVAFGGAGPMHANAVAALMGSFPVIVPPGPGLLCATVRTGPESLIVISTGLLKANSASSTPCTVVGIRSNATPAAMYPAGGSGIRSICRGT